MNLLLRLLLALHLCGLVMMAGTTAIDFLTYKTFCSMTDAGDSQAQGLLKIMSRYGTLVRIGAGILIVSGATMVIIKSTWLNEAWFKIKIGLVILLVLNGMFVGNNLGIKFRKLASGGFPFVQQGGNLRVDLNRFYLVQLMLFLLIVFVSVMRPGRH